MSRSAVASFLMISLASCNWAGERTKEALNKGGEIAGTAATEVIEGVASGVERTWNVDVRLSEELLAGGLSLGKTALESGPSGRDNRLVVYLTSTGPINDTLTAIAYDHEGLEMGRTRVAFTLAGGSGDFVVLQFQDYTDLERKSRVELR